ncbi:MAG: phosphotransferase [Caldilineaceae bacterium]
MNNVGRTMALFPGAFRPPHAAHFAAVLDLASRPEVDEVVILIANRNRTLPGTILALDATLAQRVWAIYLDACDEYPMLTKVRVEIAEHSAIQQAVDYLAHAGQGDTLYFCIGESDLWSGDERFTNLAEGAAQRGVSALIISAPTGAFAIRATDLRQALAGGEAGREIFMAALPAHLSAAQQSAVWEVSHAGLIDMTNLLREKVGAILQEQLLATAPQLDVVKRGKVDPVFRWQQENGDQFYVKYAGDTVASGCVGDPFQPKPRRRLGTERRALTYLRKVLPARCVVLPEIVKFDKATRTLVLSEVCPGGHALQQEFAHGRFDPVVAAAVGAWLAFVHTPTAAPRAFWGEDETDLAHWRTMLAWRTVEIGNADLTVQLQPYLRQLQQASDGARQPGFFHLDLVPQNIRLAASNRRAIGLIDLELCANVGDPAYELGLLLSHYLFWGIVSNRTRQSDDAMQAMLNSYRRSVASDWPPLLKRATAFSGAGLFHLLIAGPQVMDEIRCKVIATATMLLMNGVYAVEPHISSSAAQWPMYSPLTLTHDPTVSTFQ